MRGTPIVEGRYSSNNANRERSKYVFVSEKGEELRDVAEHAMLPSAPARVG